MNIYAGEDLTAVGYRSIFLAGPCPISAAVPSWRLEAVELMRDSDFTLLIPEPRNGFCIDYDGQPIWEYEGLSKAAYILFWVPRNLETMPGFTTNVEFGYWMARDPGKCVLGFPKGAPKTAYLHETAVREKVPVYHFLKSALEHFG